MGSKVTAGKNSWHPDMILPVRSSKTRHASCGVYTSPNTLASNAMLPRVRRFAFPRASVANRVVQAVQSRPEIHAPYAFKHTWPDASRYEIRPTTAKHVQQSVFSCTQAHPVFSTSAFDTSPQERFEGTWMSLPADACARIGRGRGLDKCMCMCIDLGKSMGQFSHAWIHMRGHMHVETHFSCAFVAIPRGCADAMGGPVHAEKPGSTRKARLDRSGRARWSISQLLSAARHLLLNFSTGPTCAREPVLSRGSASSCGAFMVDHGAGGVIVWLSTDGSKEA